MWIGLLCILAAVLGGCGYWVYQASQAAPEFYQQALKVEPQRQAEASDEMVRQTLELTNEARRAGEWEALFTAEQINGWLAVDLKRNHAKLLPKGVDDPRVAIAADGLRMACRYDTEKLSTVLSIHMNVELVEPNALALTVHEVRAGQLPLPLNNVTETVTRVADRLDLRLEWLKQGDSPAALIHLPPIAADSKLMLIVERLELREGALYLAGRTAPLEGKPAVALRNSGFQFTIH